MKRLAIIITGWFFVLLGIAGLFLPVLQGILFILIGLTILSAEHAWARRWVDKLRQRYPRASRQLDRFLAKRPKYAAQCDPKAPQD